MTFCRMARHKGYEYPCRQWNDRDDLEKSHEIDQGSCVLNASSNLRSKGIIQDNRERSQIRKRKLRVLYAGCLHCY